MRSTLLHTLELAVVLAAAYFVTQFFSVTNEVYVAIVALVLGAVAAFARKSKLVPIKDWVNEK
jgi:hypothetical protein